ncbi:recombinase family protein [Streptomyces sp. NPDC055722]
MRDYLTGSDLVTCHPGRGFERLGLHPHGLRQVRAVQSGAVMEVIRLDRLSRSVLHLVTFGADLRERGIGLHVIEQGIDTSTTESRAMFGVLSVPAELQRELIRRRIRSVRPFAHGPLGQGPMAPARYSAVRCSPPLYAHVDVSR